MADTLQRTANLRNRGGTAQELPKQAVKATQSTANADPQYHVDLALMGHVVAFQRHRSRLRAIQHQMRLGTVTPQPTTARRTVGAMPPMMSLGQSHRLYLLRRLHAFERRGVQWTQEEVESCMTMEQFLDYLDVREREAESPTTTSKAAVVPEAYRPSEEAEPKLQPIPKHDAGQDFLLFESTLFKQRSPHASTNRTRLKSVLSPSPRDLTSTRKAQVD